MNHTLEVFTAASHHDVLALITQIGILLLTARLLGEIVQRFGQPAVVGEILAGILLGPSCLGNIFPFIVGVIIPQKPVQGYLLEAISLIGAMFLLLLTGLETDLKLIRRHARTALGVSAGGILATFTSGFILGELLPASLLADPDQRFVFSLFIATCMSISAIPVLAKILMDLKLMRWDIGQTMIASGMTDDTVGWIMLSIVAGLAAGKIVTLSTVTISVLTVLSFMVLSFTLGRWLVKKAIDFVQDRGVSKERLLTLTIVLTFLWGSLTQSLHLEPVLGAFVMGILLGHMPRLPQSIHRSIESLTISIFAPIFFAVAGLKVNVLNLFSGGLLWIALEVILVATAGKIIGTYLGARLIGRKDHWTALSYGAALNARGAMEIIVATIGLSLGILTQEMFSIIVLMAMTTSVLAPSCLRWVLKHIQPKEEELKRLRQEQLTEESIIQRIHRVLMPIREWQSAAGQNMHTVKACILQRMASKIDLSVTILHIQTSGGKSDNTPFLDQLAQKFSKQELIKKSVPGSNVVDAILDEANKDYDLLVLGGSTPSKNQDHIFSEIIDSLVSLPPCTTIVIHAQEVDPQWKPQKILVPTNGSLASKRAAEFAFLLPQNAEEEVIILTVVEKGEDDWHYDMQSDAFQRQLKIARRMAEDLRDLGELRGVRAFTEVQTAREPETAILNMAKEQKVDLIILGTDVRSASNRLFLGPRVERILRNTPCPVIILNSIA